MRWSPLFLAVIFAGAGCGSSDAPPDRGDFGLRMWVTQALPPVGSFGTASPTLAIADGLLVSHGPQIAIYPGPLLPNLVARPISGSGIDRVLAAAESAGLLNGPTDLTDGIPPGGQTGHIRFVIDGREREVVGDPGRQIVCIQAPCNAPPATPEAFGMFWAQLSDPATVLGPELGAETAYAIERVAVLVTDPPPDEELLSGSAVWPLAGSMAEFGAPYAGGPARCGIVEGADLAPAVAAFRSANQLTRWHDRGETEYGLVVRPLLPGEPDPCGPN